MRMINELAKQPRFETYPLATHLTYPWLGGNLRLPNQQSMGEKILGPEFMRNYNLQQLDWAMGVCNLGTRSRSAREITWRINWPSMVSLSTRWPSDSFRCAPLSKAPAKGILLAGYEPGVDRHGSALPGKGLASIARTVGTTRLLGLGKDYVHSLRRGRGQQGVKTGLFFLQHSTHDRRAMTEVAGLDHHSVEPQHQLHTLPGEKFTGPELMCLAYVGARKLAFNGGPWPRARRAGNAIPGRLSGNRPGPGSAGSRRAVKNTRPFSIYA